MKNRNQVVVDLNPTIPIIALALNNLKVQI